MARPSRTAKPAKSRFGTINKLPSGRFRARYVGPDGQRHSAPGTFDTITDADAWLAVRRAEVLKNEWTPPVITGQTFGPYSRQWLSDRALKPRTREDYEYILDHHLTRFDDLALRAITPEMVTTWHTGLVTGPTMRAHAYSLLKTILKTATEYDLISANPCRIRGAGSAKRVHKVRPVSLPELEVMVGEMPPRWRLMLLFGAWGALRYGELIALRRKDISADGATIRIRRGITRTKKLGRVEGTPKSDAGTRDVAVPPHLVPVVLAHLDEHAQPGRDGLLFPSATGIPLPTVTFNKYWYRSRAAADRDDCTFHDLRHTGAVMAAATGATIAELMARLGHSTPGAAMRYQHAAQERDVAIAALMSEMAKKTF